MRSISRLLSAEVLVFDTLLMYLILPSLSVSKPYPP